MQDLFCLIGGVGLAIMLYLWCKEEWDMERHGKIMRDRHDQWPDAARFQ